jgi:hypothetical protein
MINTVMEVTWVCKKCGVQFHNKENGINHCYAGVMGESDWQKAFTFYVGESKDKNNL